MENRKILNEYSFGEGITGVQSGYIEYTTGDIELFIDLANLKQSYEIGSEPNESPEEFTRLVFKNLKGLNCLQEAIDYVRKKLENGGE